MSHCLNSSGHNRTNYDNPCACKEHPFVKLLGKCHLRPGASGEELAAPLNAWGLFMCIVVAAFGQYLVVEQIPLRCVS